MNKLSTIERAQIVRALVEGNSIRATVRITGFSKNTIVKLLREIGEACMEYQDRVLRDLPCRRVQVDEIWSFVYAKERHVPEAHKGEFGYGDVWTWTAICADTKIVPCWHIGRRDGSAAYYFISDLASRLSNRIQLTTDGHKPYLNAVENAFGCDIDYAMLVKLYGGSQEPETRYSPAQCLGSQKIIISGNPDADQISTSYAERQNLTMRMSMRRFTRLTNGFSKKVENLAYAVALHFMYYSFGRIHKTLRVTPAMEAGISDHVWTVEEIVGLTN